MTIGVGFTFVGQIAQEKTGDYTLLMIGVSGMVLWLAFTVWVIIQMAKAGDAGSNTYGPPDEGAPAVKATQPSSPVAVPAAPNQTAYEAIERLGKLKEQGLLSDEEFAEQKRRLLS